jgi:hypothetical protein
MAASFSQRRRTVTRGKRDERRQAITPRAAPAIYARELPVMETELAKKPG